MKLYTEKEIKFAMLSAYLTGVSRPPSYEELIISIFNSLTPIELPSDEEIRKRGWEDADAEDDIAFFVGAKWMKEQILNQNK